jgi:hypothetical protein
MGVRGSWEKWATALSIGTAVEELPGSIRFTEYLHWFVKVTF